MKQDPFRSLEVAPTRWGGHSSVQWQALGAKFAHDKGEKRGRAGSLQREAGSLRKSEKGRLCGDPAGVADLLHENRLMQCERQSICPFFRAYQGDLATRQFEYLVRTYCSGMLAAQCKRKKWRAEKNQDPPDFLLPNGFIKFSTAQYYA